MAKTSLEGPNGWSWCGREADIHTENGSEGNRPFVQFSAVGLPLNEQWVPPLVMPCSATHLLDTPSFDGAFLARNAPLHLEHLILSHELQADCPSNSRWCQLASSIESNLT
jgi:hypothetical protein